MYQRTMVWLTVLNGLEDRFIQWTYGRALVEGIRQALAPDKARLVTCAGPDGAGHGLLIQHPRWTQEAIFDALQRCGSEGTARWLAASDLQRRARTQSNSARSMASPLVQYPRSLGCSPSLQS